MSINGISKMRNLRDKESPLVIIGINKGCSVDKPQEKSLKSGVEFKEFGVRCVTQVGFER